MIAFTVKSHWIEQFRDVRNVSCWLHPAVKATSSTRPEQPQLRTSERECPESCRFRPVYPRVRTRRALSVDGEL
jgi:hypothetical protein